MLRFENLINLNVVTYAAYIFSYVPVLILLRFLVIFVNLFFLVVNVSLITLDPIYEVVGQSNLSYLFVFIFPFLLYRNLTYISILISINFDNDVIHSLLILLYIQKFNIKKENRKCNNAKQIKFFE